VTGAASAKVADLHIAPVLRISTTRPAPASTSREKEVSIGGGPITGVALRYDSPVGTVFATTAVVVLS